MPSLSMVLDAPGEKPQKTSGSYLILPIWIIAAILMCAMLEEATNIFLWIVCSFFLMALLDPALVRLRRFMPKSLAALLLVFGATVIAMAFVYFLVHFSAQMVADLESSKKMLLHYYRSLRATWQSWMQVLTPPGHGSHTMAAPSTSAGAAPAPAPAPGATPSPIPLVSAPAAAPAPAAQASGGAPFGSEFATTVARGLGSFFTILVYTFLVPVLTFFMLSEREHMGGVIQKAMQKPQEGPRMWQRIVEAIRAYFFGNLLLGVVSFPILAGLMFAFKVPSPVTLAALASVFNLIPFLGAVLSGFLPALALVSTGAHGGSVFALYALCAVFHMFLANFVTPKVLGQRLNVNATTSTLALVIFGELCGGVGLLIAIPLVAVFKIMFETSDIWWLQWIASLMNDKDDRTTASKRPPAV